MVGSGRLRQPPLPALGARFTGLEDFGQGKGVNSDLASTQGGALTAPALGYNPQPLEG